jgi:hypothetical protein
MAAAKLTLDLLETTSLEVSCQTRMPFFPEPFLPGFPTMKLQKKIFFFRFTRKFHTSLLVVGEIPG